METVLVTGGNGLVGSAIKSIHQSRDYDFIFLSSKECDLTNLDETKSIFKKYNPSYVIHLAACVGGLYKNMNYKVDMFEKNMAINLNVLKCCHDFKVKKCISCLSTCIFPDKTTYPINEEMLHLGPPHNSNDAYAYAKRMLDVHSKAYREQYGDDFMCIIPTNIYGPHDNYHLEDSHVIPALIHKCYLAKKENKPFVVWGSGTPLRQFIYSEDLAELILFTLFDTQEKETLILSVSEEDEVSIADVAKLIAKEFDYPLEFDTSKSDGQFKKTADNTKLKKLYKEINNKDLYFKSMSEGIKLSVKWFVDNYENCRK